MTSRRRVIAGLISTPIFLRGQPVLAQQPPPEPVPDSFDQLIYPPTDAIFAPERFGYLKPTQEQRERIRKIISETPKGPTPLAIAQSFVERFATSEPDLISQWPAPETWNPLIVEFFGSTASPANNDMVPWCAAFANWCIDRNGKVGTRSAASQSFLEKKNARYFSRVQQPEPGNLAIWTCYDLDSGKSLGLGHVAFVSGKPDAKSVPTVSGNTSDDRHSSRIVEKPFSLLDRKANRTINRKKVPCLMKFNTYLKISEG